MKEEEEEKKVIVNWFKKPYSEKPREEYKPSYIEVLLCYLSLIIWVWFSLYVWFGKCWNGFSDKHFLLLFPPVFWIFLRISRKDMKATAYLVGAIFGALVVILTKLLPISLH